ncbi:hypothetical protein [Xanthomonas campestris]|uniref:hypothetical protein n=2 Tax=Xanthomonas campestris TaxID=339 RepID=UPI002366F4AB|nr:hypothetical protein [Xanthomonas campestris]MEA9709935.1 hypothetical protein [Xanthomonas campestris]MEA9784051.1 hypothetical protein [Xanthomonas campestris pv. raphani]MEA9804361.1 hypothetical protein [Xanthomonas campestris pv. raphani]MEA9821009.1 hypothetical protein [Xanthomonas campestris pv. raphani]MEA9873601.1 hypothetical protein [Xanthomonas campestris pv. raphani]
MSSQEGPTMPAVAVQYFFGLALVAAMTGLAACGAAPEQSKPAPPISREAATKRSVVPLTRPVALDKAGTIADLEFDVSPPRPGASSDLMLGLRVWAADATSMYEIKDSINGGEFLARLHLTRVDGAAPVQIAMTRISKDLSHRLPVAESGEVSGTTSTSVDSAMLEDAGLLDQSSVYGVLSLAQVERAAPGRYRLVVELKDDRPDLITKNVELIVAYFNKGK